VLFETTAAMSPEYDWRDIEVVDYERTDPLARFVPETPPTPRTSPQPTPLQQTPRQPAQLPKSAAEVRPERPVLPQQRPNPRARPASAFMTVAVLAGSLTFAALSVWRGAPPRDPMSPALRAAPPAPVSAPSKVTDAATSVAAPATFAPSAPRLLPLQVAGGAFSPSFATTGSTLFFHAGRLPEARLARTDLDENGGPQRIVTIVAGGANYHARVSPDGRQIAFDSDRYGGRSVFLAQIDGSNIRRVGGPGYAELPSWSPDGKWLAFVRGEPGRSRVWNLWVRNMQTSRMIRLTSFRTGQTWTGSWFPDSRRVAFSHDDQLTVTDITNGQSQVYRSPKKGSAVRTPAVSPDGLRVIFQVTRSGAWVLDLRTRTMKPVLDDDPTAEEFAWDPSGSRVAYHSKRGGEWRIWIVSVPL